MASCLDRVKRIQGQQGHVRWCIARLIPIDGNELLALDLERLQSFTKKEGEE
jgi:hypothetical protein